MKKSTEKKNVYRNIGIGIIAAPCKQPSPVTGSKITGKGDLRGGKR